jgi:UDP-N-acetylglucosamine 2-epimerase
LLAPRHLTVLHVVGARPDFMKVAPVLRALDARKGFRSVLVHTGQHYATQMSASFFDDLQIPPPHVNRGVGSGSHGAHTTAVMSALEPHLVAHLPQKALSRCARVFRPRAWFGRFRSHDDSARQRWRPDGT